MTNLLGFPRASVVSATIAAMTAPTNPTPMTTTTSFPSARAASASRSRRLSSAAYSCFSGSGNCSPAGLTDCSGMGLAPLVRCGRGSPPRERLPEYCLRPAAVNDRGLATTGAGVLYRIAMELSMSLEEAMRTQRAIRRLKADPVDDALVLHLIELALKGPTGSNAQGWEFVVVRDRAVKERLGALNRRAWSLYGGLGRRLYRSDPGMMRIMAAVQWQADHFAEIPVLVVPCLRGLIPPFPRIAVSSLYGSIYPSIQNLLLAARAAGLRAAPITLPPWSTSPARRPPGPPSTV